MKNCLIFIVETDFDLNFGTMSEELEFENGLLSFANPNYQLDPADINSNLEAIEDFEDLYEELDTVCRYNRKSGIKSRRNYAHLDPESMGVKIDPESSPMLAADSDNNLKRALHSSTFNEKRYQKIDNDNVAVDSNDNKEMGRKSGILDYYLSLEAASWPQKDVSPLLHNVQCNNTLTQSESQTAARQQKELTIGSEDGKNSQVIMSHFNNSIADDITSLSEKNTISFRDQQMPSLCNIPSKHSTNHNNGKCISRKDFKENDTLPSGWERHEDDSGPYYWHIGSGTIQREPPVLCSSNGKSSSHVIKEMDMISSMSDLSLHSCKSSTPIPPVLSDQNRIKTSSIGEGKLKRRSYPEGPCCPTSDKRPIRFAVRSLGWVEIAEDDLTPEKSSKAVNKCIVDLSMGRNDILDVVGRWGDGKDLFMDLDDYSLRLMATQDLTILNTQPIHTIRVWGVGRDNGRDFAYVARDRVTRKYMCHVFRCDIPARIIANTLRDICKRIMIERSLQHSLAKQVGPSLEANSENCGLGIPGPIRPTNLPTEQRRFLSTDCQSSCTTQSFPTPMEEPKKVLKVYYLGMRNVDKATGVEVLNDAIEEISLSVSPSEYKFVNVAVAPSTITISEPGDDGKMLAECRVRFLSFLGIGKNIKHCGFIVHTAQDEFVAHVFYCEPSSGALCKTIEAACKLRYQKCLDAHRQVNEKRLSESQGNKGLATTIRSLLGSIGRLTKSTET